jgi:hypothetical protein
MTARAQIRQPAPAFNTKVTNEKPPLNPRNNIPIPISLTRMAYVFKGLWCIEGDKGGLF